MNEWVKEEEEEEERRDAETTVNSTASSIRRNRPGKGISTAYRSQGSFELSPEGEEYDAKKKGVLLEGMKKSKT